MGAEFWIVIIVVAGALIWAAATKDPVTQEARDNHYKETEDESYERHIEESKIPPR